jgi:hypothetical protein
MSPSKPPSASTRPQSSTATTPARPASPSSTAKPGPSSSKPSAAPCTEAALRTAADTNGGRPLSDKGGGTTYVYDAFKLHACKDGHALVEASRSSGSTFTFWAMTWSNNSWRVKATSGVRTDTPPSTPVWTRSALQTALGSSYSAFLAAVGSTTKTGRPIVG